MALGKWLKVGIPAVVGIACSIAIAATEKVAWPPDPTDWGTWGFLAAAFVTFIGVYSALSSLSDKSSAIQGPIFGEIKPAERNADQIQSIVEDLKERGTLDPIAVPVPDDHHEAMHARDKLVEIVVAGVLPQEENLRIAQELQIIAFSGKVSRDG